MYWFGLVDAGVEPTTMLEIVDRFDPELRVDLSSLIAQVVGIPPPAASYLTEDERRSPAELVRQMLREVRGQR
jgi:hypothetical protein